MCKHVSHTKTKNSVNDKTAAGTHSHLHINENTHAYQDVQSASLLLVIWMHETSETRKHTYALCLLMWLVLREPTRECEGPGVNTSGDRLAGS